ncbi:hypothetical protein ANN_05890 [Periplaneta americana]|uniref:Uncharacterized protein n=1 Tax=Periplaneta americana TaxID=6978 RepID=A0ABQ8TC15_PERAM|nr:hypothetical protein ANN_05890 [Periplaneta americana]
MADLCESGTCDADDAPRLHDDRRVYKCRRRVAGGMCVGGRRTARMIEEEPPKCYIPRSLDWQGWAGTVATSITGPNPLDFFLWGDMKRLVYEIPIDRAENLVARVVETAHVIRDNVSLFERRRHSIVRRYQLCNAFNGRQFEHHL